MPVYKDVANNKDRFDRRREKKNRFERKQLTNLFKLKTCQVYAKLSPLYFVWITTLFFEVFTELQLTLN